MPYTPCAMPHANDNVCALLKVRFGGNFVRGRFTVALFLLFFAGYLALFPLVALAVQFPEPDPPKIDIAPKEQSLQPHAAIPQEAPATEWTLHKTSDNTHPDGNEQAFMWFMNFIYYTLLTYLSKSGNIKSCNVMTDDPSISWSYFFENIGMPNFNTWYFADDNRGTRNFKGFPLLQFRIMHGLDELKKPLFSQKGLLGQTRIIIDPPGTDHFYSGPVFLYEQNGSSRSFLGNNRGKYFGDAILLLCRNSC